MQALLAHCLPPASKIAHSSRGASSCSSHYPCVQTASQVYHGGFRDIVCRARVSLSDFEKEAAEPSLASLNKLDLSSAMMLANLMKPTKEQYAGPPKDDNDLALDGTDRPNDPVSVKDFVQALEVIARSSNNEVNPEQLGEIMFEVVERKLAAEFTPEQIGVTLKNLAVICDVVPLPLLGSLICEMGQRMTAFEIPHLSNVNWALIRLMDVADQQMRDCLDMDDHWLQQYHAACEQQLQQVVQQQLPVPTTQQLANLLLIPAAAQQPFSAECQQVFEQAVVMSQRRLCGMAAAQLFTCYLGLQQRPGQQMLDVLLQHLQEDYLLYDYDELTQVAVGIYSLGLQLPNKVLADITERCEMLEASKQADQEDVTLMKECMSRLAKAAMVAA